MIVRGTSDAHPADMLRSVALVLLGSACSPSSSTPATVVNVTSAPVVADAYKLDANIREYLVPTPDAVPHDTAVGVDGTLWFTEYGANTIGHFDPMRESFREYVLPMPGSGPHGIAVDRQGHPWFTAATGGYVGTLDPSTGEVEEHYPDVSVGDPHSLDIAPDGTIWFTAERANAVGRLDPVTGEMDTASVPTGDAKPYGIVVGADGAPYFAELGASHVGRIDPQTMAIHELELPLGARPRRIALAPDGSLYYTDYARGILGRLDPSTLRVAERPSIGGPDSRPYAIAITPGDGLVWSVETGTDPNMLVRYNPRTGRMLHEAIPSGGGVVRSMAATRDGRLYFACSGTNRIAIVAPR